MFTFLGLLAAWIALVLAAMRIAISFWIINTAHGGDLELAREMASRYLGSTTPGQAINEATIVVACAIALGVITDISRYVRRISRQLD